VVAPGINSKMDEIRAAYGLLNLKQVDGAIAKRKATAEKYREALKDIPGVRCLQDIEGVHHNYAYFPIFVDEKEYGMSRDALYAKLQEHNIYGRRYFYPLISTCSAYKGLESANPKNLPVAHKLADQVPCLPMFAGLDEESANRVIDVVKNKR
jgi:dTDP-4-amino-4,6-dideoxygalactose transaminase